MFWVLIINFLAHLSLEAVISELIVWAGSVARPSLSVVVRLRPHSLNIFSSEIAWPIKVKFHTKPPWDRGTNVCSKGSGHMTKLAAMPMWGKNLKKSSSPEPKGWWPWKLVCRMGCSCSTKFIQIMTLSWPWPILRQGQIRSLMLLYG